MLTAALRAGETQAGLLRRRASLANASGTFAMTAPPSWTDAGRSSELDVLLFDLMGKPVCASFCFIATVGLLLAFDPGVLRVAESLRSVALGPGGVIWWWMGSQSGFEYLTGFVVEKSLALDNIFIIALISSYFAIPQAYQHRVLVHGILGVLVLRSIMIAAGAAILGGVLRTESRSRATCPLSLINAFWHIGRKMAKSRRLVMGVGVASVVELDT